MHSPKAPTIAPPSPAPPPPTVDQAVQTSRAAEDLRRRRGAAANVLAGAQQTQSPVTGTAAKLLGT